MNHILRKLDMSQWWGGDILIRSISPEERDSLLRGVAQYKKNKGEDEGFARTFLPKVAALAICDETGKRLFGDDEIELLAQKNTAAINHIAVNAAQFSGFSQRDLRELQMLSGLRRRTK